MTKNSNLMMKKSATEADYNMSQRAMSVAADHTKTDGEYWTTTQNEISYLILFKKPSNVVDW
jgi:hypothetical protein